MMMMREPLGAFLHLYNRIVYFVYLFYRKKGKSLELLLLLPRVMQIAWYTPSADRLRDPPAGAKTRRGQGQRPTWLTTSNLKNKKKEYTEWNVYQNVDDDLIDLSSVLIELYRNMSSRKKSILLQNGFLYLYINTTYSRYCWMYTHVTEFRWLDGSNCNVLKNRNWAAHALFAGGNEITSSTTITHYWVCVFFFYIIIFFLNVHPNRM